MKVRLLTEDDRAWLNEAVAKDFYHAAAGITGKHWLDGVGRKESTVYEDEDGPLVVLRALPILHVDLQLCSTVGRNRKALNEGIPPFMMLANSKGFHGITSAPASQMVKNFLSRRYHFEPVEEYRFMFPEER